MVTASLDKTARIWDARTGAQLAVLKGHADVAVFGELFARRQAHRHRLSDKTARIWDARTGARSAVLSGHGDMRPCAAYSPDGARIVTASADKTARIWDARTGAQLAVLSGHGDAVYSAAYSPDGARIVTASYDRTARIWDARTGAQLAVLSGHGGRRWPPPIRPTARASSPPLRIGRRASGMHARHADRRPVRPWRCVAFAAYSPDGTQIVTASDDKSARLWDARRGAPLARALRTGRLRRSRSLLAGRHAYRDLIAATRPRASGTRAPARSSPCFPATSIEFDSAAYSPDGTRIVTASSDKTALVWDASSGAQLAVLVRAPRSRLRRPLTRPTAGVW